MPRISNQKILIKEPYRSILNLLKIYGYLDGRRIGLQHFHFLYALKSKQLKMNYETEQVAKDFFSQFLLKNPPGNGIHALYLQKKKLKTVEQKLSHEVKRGCIKRPQHLNDILGVLIRKKWVDIEGKPKYRKYYLSRKYWTDLEKRRISAVLHKWDDNMVITSESLYRFYLDNPDGFNPLKRGDRSCPLEENNTFFLCGVPLDVIKNLSAEEKKNLNDWLIKVETYLWKIMELKYSKAKISVKEYIKKERQGKITTDDLIQSNTMGFYYSAYKSIIEE